MTQFPIIMLVWKDHNSSHEDWTDLNNVVPSAVEIVTAGHLIKETDDMYSVALNIGAQDSDRDCSQVINIVKSCVVKKAILRRGKK